MKTAEFMQAGNLWPQALAEYGLEVTGNKHIRCPLCDKKKFRISNRTQSGDYICTCSHGDGFALLKGITGKSFADIAAELDKQFGNQQIINKPSINHQKPAEYEQFKNRFMSLGKLKGSPVEEYLRSRGIYELPQRGVKYSASEHDYEYNRPFQAMYSIATDDNYKIIHRHLTYLEDGKKAAVEKAKKMKGENEHKVSVAVRMFDVDSTLGIAEGIETALAAKQLYKWPTWSTLNADNMRKFRAPKIDTLIIYADNDRNGTGLAAAFECGSKNVIQGRAQEAIIKWPERAGTDFADMLTEPQSVYEWKLSR